LILFPGADANPSPAAAAARAEVRRLIEHAIDELPESFRLVFVMRDVEEMSIEETARSFDIRPETVKTRLHRARSGGASDRMIHPPRLDSCLAHGYGVARPATELTVGRVLSR
jgi:DNA-directed RNA polymerase specialized sigma24 family protein